MKKCLLLFYICSICNFGFSQNLNKLDIKYGFNKFKLETSYNLLKSQLELFDNIDNFKYCIYKGKDIESVFGVKVKKVTLTFYKNQLFQINIFFDEDVDKYLYKDYVVEKLMSLYGNCSRKTDYSTGPLEYEWGYSWKSSKAYLSFDHSKNGETQIWIMSLKMNEKYAQDEF